MCKSNIHLLKKLSAVFLIGVQCAAAQTVEVVSQNKPLAGKKLTGFVTTLEAAKDEVTPAVMRYLKVYGKPKQQETHIQLLETTLNGQVFANPLYALVAPTTTGSTLWLGISKTEWGADSSKILPQLEQIAKSMGVAFYRDKIQAQIDEAQQAVQAVERQQQRTANEEQNILQRTENNKREYRNLKTAIQRNRADSVTLYLKRQQNMRSSDSLRMVSDKVRKALFFQQERQRKVN